jgi:O-acetyl-ADP-ribose deacetylase (regulator of RNase III)
LAEASIEEAARQNDASHDVWKFYVGPEMHREALQKVLFGAVGADVLRNALKVVEEMSVEDLDNFLSNASATQITCMKHAAWDAMLKAYESKGVVGARAHLREVLEEQINTINTSSPETRTGVSPYTAELLGIRLHN